jgi:hypothetical protein
MWAMGMGVGIVVASLMAQVALAEPPGMINLPRKEPRTNNVSNFSDANVPGLTIC